MIEFTSPAGRRCLRSEASVDFTTDEPLPDAVFACSWCGATTFAHAEFRQPLRLGEHNVPLGREPVIVVEAFDAPRMIRAAMPEPAVVIAGRLWRLVEAVDARFLVKSHR